MDKSITRFAFWDFETTGVSKQFDAPTDVGILTTDASLDPLDEFSLACRPSLYSLPHPRAINVTGVGIEELMSRNLSLREFMLTTSRHVNSITPACFVTYNGISFDDEIYRHSAYRCLLPPYAMQFGGNSRLDMLKLARIAHIVQPGVLTVPTDDDGALTFRLDQIAPANGFAGSGAHTAIVDARATAYLARLLRQRNTVLWEYAVRSWTDKNEVRHLLETNDFVVSVEWHPKMRKPIVKALVPVGVNPSYTSEYGCLDLSFDASALSGLTESQIQKAICVGTTARPICPIRLNAMPTIFAPNDPMVSALLPDNALALTRKAREVASTEAVRDIVIRALEFRRANFQEPEYVEQCLYSGGFFSNHDSALMARFHMADPGTQLNLVMQMEDSRLQVLGLRILFEECPYVLPQATRLMLSEEVKNRWHPAGKVPWTSAISAKEEILGLSTSVGAEKRLLLEEYDSFLSELLRNFPQAA